ncbi:NAD-dependent epimerase/dehydratase family protein [Herbiconiux liangxiaofengii]|uniref:NAD-dependent epimerase/dehydratase family protein n=1 Tax=Herbiconiux liangxiaofengii TaxID=3342795 RepID=UPI0035B7C8EB
MKIAVIGATGNLGTALLRRLSREAGATEVVGVARRIPDRDRQYAEVQWHAVDVSKPDARALLAPALHGVDAVVHLAWALQPNHVEKAMWRTNVHGTAAVLDAAVDAGVPHVLVASSVGAYSPGPKSRRVNEDWPTGGLATSHYSRYKAINERRLDDFEGAHPSVVVTRLRPGLVFQSKAASEIARLFAGPFVPRRLLGRLRSPIVTLPSQLISQVVHADDVADAFWRAIERRQGGAFNIAAEPVVTPEVLAGALGGRAVPIRAAVVRALMWATWKARLQPSDPGWLDIATTVPVMSTERARTLLGWAPTISSTDALRELLDGLAAADGEAGSPPLGGGGARRAF